MCIQYCINDKSLLWIVESSIVDLKYIVANSSQMIDLPVVIFLLTISSETYLRRFFFNDIHIDT